MIIFWPFILDIKLLLQTFSKVGDHPDDRHEVGPHVRGLADLLVDLLRELRGQDLHQGGEGQLPHRVLLDRAAGEVGVGGEGEVVDGLDES